MTSRELVLAALRGEKTPRPPVICPGGMMSFAVTEVMQATGCGWPQAHQDAVTMATLALAMQAATGVDNVGLPFCMTVEAEALGAEVNYGTPTVQPWIAREPLEDIGQVPELERFAGTQPDRRGVVLEAIRLARSCVPGVATVGSTVGPVSLAAQQLEASLLFRAMRREPDLVRALLAKCTEFLCEFAQSQVAAGADVIMIGDPTATGEILGGRLYAEFAAPHSEQLIAAVHAAGAPVILHICGNPRTILPTMAGAGAEAVSVDETANLREAREAVTAARLMGNVASELLEAGTVEAIRNNVARVLEVGVDIVAPACGVTAATPVRNLKAMVEGAGGE